METLKANYLGIIPETAKVYALGLTFYSTKFWSIIVRRNAHTTNGSTIAFTA